MFHAVTGTVEKLTPPQIAVTASGVGYLLHVPASVWEDLKNGEERTLYLTSHIREDRFDLFGFLSVIDRTFFQSLVALDGIGPKTALEICSVPRSLLVASILADDAKLLTNIKGIGKKTAEKLLVDLKQLIEKHPEWATEAAGAVDEQKLSASFDRDAIAALVSLGFDERSAMKVLKGVPSSLSRTEDRVAAALRSL